MTAANWQGLIPRGREAREDLDAVKARVLAHVETASADLKRSRAVALAMPAEEMARILVIHGTHGPGDVAAIARACNESLLRGAISEVERGAGADAITGLMSFANVRIAAGDEVPGLHDQQTRRLRGYERTWLDDLSRQAGGLDAATRGLAITIALSLSDDTRFALFGAPAPSLQRLVDGPNDPQRYRDLIAAFPDVELSWSELLFVARAFCVRFDRDRTGYQGAARWLHQLVRGEEAPRKTLAAPAIVPRVPDANLVRRASELFTDRGRLPRADAATWIAIELGHLHGLWGGHDLRVRSDGGVIAKARPAGGTLAYHVGRMSPAGLSELDALLAEPDRFASVAPARPGIPDEAAASLTLVTAAARRHAFKWDADHHEGFDRVRDWLDEAARALIAASPAQVKADVVGIGRSLDEEVAPLWARYLAATNRVAPAFEVAADVIRRAHTDEPIEAAVAMLERYSAFPVIEPLCADVASQTTGNRLGRALGAALGRLRWLPALAPLIGQPFERACGAMHGAIAAMMGRAEPGDAARMLEVLLPAARAVVPEPTNDTPQLKAERCRRALLCDLAAALAKCGQRGCASALADEIRSELDGLSALQGVHARAWLAIAVAAAGDATQARELLDEAARALDAHVADDVDDSGVPWIDVVAYARAKVEHLATWAHGMPWEPILPVSRQFVGPLASARFPPERAAQEAWRNEIDFRITASALKTNFSQGQLARAMDVVDRAFGEQPEYAPLLLAHLAGQITEMDDASAARLVARLDALPPGSGCDPAIEAGARALARCDRGTVALALARRLESVHRTRATLEIAMTLAGQSKTRDLGLAAAQECLRVPGARPDAWLALADALLDDEVPAEPRMVLRMSGENADTFTIPDQLMHLVLTFGNGLDGDVRITCSDHEAVVLARGIAIGTGNCRRIAPPSDSALCRPGDECYRQHERARVFLSPLPTG